MEERIRTVVTARKSVKMQMRKKDEEKYALLKFMSAS